MKTIYLFLTTLMFIPISLAGQKVYRVEYESQADLKIYKVKYLSQAGWEKKEKQHLLL